jgi:hypothetical protein
VVVSIRCTQGRPLRRDQGGGGLAAVEPGDQQAGRAVRHVLAQQLFFFARGS